MRATNPAFSARFMMAMVISKLLNRNSSGPSRFTQKNNGAIAVRQFCSVRKWPLLAAFGCPRDQPGHGYLEHSDCDSEPCARGESHRQTARLALVAANQFAFLSWPRDVAAARDYAEHDEFAGIRPEFSIGLADAFARRRGLSHVAHRANPGNARDAVSVLSVNNAVVPSVEPSSTTMISRSESAAARTAEITLSIVLRSLKTG